MPSPPEPPELLPTIALPSRTRLFGIPINRLLVILVGLASLATALISILGALDPEGTLGIVAALAAFVAAVDRFLKGWQAWEERNELPGLVGPGEAAARAAEGVTNITNVGENVGGGGKVPFEFGTSRSEPPAARRITADEPTLVVGTRDATDPPESAPDGAISLPPNQPDEDRQEELAALDGDPEDDGGDPIPDEFLDETDDRPEAHR